MERSHRNPDFCCLILPRARYNEAFREFPEGLFWEGMEICLIDKPDSFHVPRFFLLKEAFFSKIHQRIALEVFAIEFSTHLSSLVTLQVVSSKHQAPRGGMFEYVSSPHYLAEIMVYNGLTIILWNFNLTWFNGLLWTWVNQTAMALLSHRWYLSNFRDYPKTRTALIPLVL